MNKEGIELLKSDLRHYAKSYNQNTFGSTWLKGRSETSDRGTFMCAAGLCLMRKIGTQGFYERVKEAESNNYTFFVRFRADCMNAGIEQLGLGMGISSPDIFSAVEHWPLDLYREYEFAETPKALVEVACKALDLIDEYGNFKDHFCDGEDDEEEDDIPF